MVMHPCTLVCPTGITKCSMAPKGSPWDQEPGVPPNSAWWTIPLWDAKCPLANPRAAPLVSANCPCCQPAHYTSAKSLSAISWVAPPVSITYPHYWYTLPQSAKSLIASTQTAPSVGNDHPHYQYAHTMSTKSLLAHQWTAPLVSINCPCQQTALQVPSPCYAPTDHAQCPLLGHVPQGDTIMILLSHPVRVYQTCRYVLLWSEWNK